MKQLLLVLTISFISMFSTWGQERASLSIILPLLEEYVGSALNFEGIPGAIVVIVKDGKLVYMKGFGVKILGQTDIIDEHSPFALASVTKNITNTLVARLVDQGKLEWSDKVIKYLPNFQLSNQSITQELTIEDLLSHRSGLPGFSGDTLNELGWPASEIVSAMKLIPIEGEFRKSYEYQNVLVGLVGLIIEKVTGKPLEQVYEEELFKPIGLTETRFGERNPPSFWQKLLRIFQKQKPQPVFHDRYDGKVRYLPNGNPGCFTFPASSGIISTGQDLGKWLIFQLNQNKVNEKELVSEKNINLMRSPHVDVGVKGGRQFPKNRVSHVQYGLGWFIHDYMGMSVLSHMGGMAGTRALLCIAPQDNLGIAILTNFGGMRVSLFPEAIRNKFFDLYLNVKEEVDWAKKLRESIWSYYDNIQQQRRLQMLRALESAKELSYYIGVYENTLYGRVEIRNEDGKLVLVYRDRPETKLAHWNGNSFDINGSDLSFGFSGTDKGELTFSADPGTAGRMMISLFHEGSDPTFHRVN